MGGLCSSSNFDLSVFVCGGRAVKKEENLSYVLSLSLRRLSYIYSLKGKPPTA